VAPTREKSRLSARRGAQIYYFSRRFKRHVVDNGGCPWILYDGLDLLERPLRIARLQADRATIVFNCLGL
jgi:hypothetical protein